MSVLFTVKFDLSFRNKAKEKEDEKHLQTLLNKSVPYSHLYD